MPTMGALRCWPPNEPSEGVPKENTPPSEAVIRYPGPLLGADGPHPRPHSGKAIGLPWAAEKVFSQLSPNGSDTMWANSAEEPGYVAHSASYTSSPMMST